MAAAKTGRSTNRSSAKPYLWAVGLLWVLPLVLIIGGYFGMWLFFPPDNSPSSDRVDPGFLVLLVGLLAYPYFVVTGLVVVGVIVLWQLWSRGKIRRQGEDADTFSG